MGKTPLFCRNTSRFRQNDRVGAIMRRAARCGEGESQRVSGVQQTLGRARRGKHAVFIVAMIQ
jgi:hypothetical protein